MPSDEQRERQAEDHWREWMDTLESGNVSSWESYEAGYRARDEEVEALKAMAVELIECVQEARKPLALAVWRASELIANTEEEREADEANTSSNHE